MSRIADLIAELATPASNRVLVAFAGHARPGPTGELARIGAVIDRACILLSAPHGRWFRVLHGIAAVLMPGRVDASAFVARAGAVCALPQVEFRSVMVCFGGRRDVSWLDALLADLSTRDNFGRFADEPVERRIDGELVAPRGE